MMAVFYFMGEDNQIGALCPDHMGKFLPRQNMKRRFFEMKGFFRKEGISLPQLVFVLGLMLLLPLFAGCSSSDNEEENTVEVCNEDNEDYYVELRRNSDDALIGTVEVDEFYSGGQNRCEKFKNLDPGSYYIVIYERPSENPSDTSSSFYLERNGYHNFDINSSGDIEQGSSSSKGNIEVCNSDDEEYDVELYRESDGQRIDDFRVGEFYDSDRCDNFNNIASDDYYIVINEVGAENSEESETFYLRGDDTERFRIESPGNIIRD